MAKKTPEDIARRKRIQSARAAITKGIGTIVPEKPKALFVEMPADQIEHYKDLAKQMGGISMRELVTRGLQELEQRWRDSNASAGTRYLSERVLGRKPSMHSNSVDIISQLFEPTPEQKAEAAVARHRDIAFPELVSTQNGRLVQMVDVSTLRQRLFDQDARIARLESQVRRLEENDTGPR